MGKNVRKDNNLLTELGRRLKQVREEKNITHETIDDTLKITIYKYEKAQLNISLTTLALICKFYQITLSDLLQDLESSFSVEK